MSTVGATINPSTNSSHRRRVPDPMNDQEKDKPSDAVQISLEHSKSDIDTEALFNCNNGLLHRHHTAVRYFLASKRLPEKWVLRVEECVVCVGGVLSSLTRRKNLGRVVLVLLLMMAVASAFSLLMIVGGGGGGGTAVDMARNFVRPNFKNEYFSNAQKEILGWESWSSVGQKRKMKEFPVSYKNGSSFN